MENNSGFRTLLMILTSLAICLWKEHMSVALLRHARNSLAQGVQSAKTQ